jgi:Di-haem oxidoreductase, putative peroxidase
MRNALASRHALAGSTIERAHRSSRFSCHGARVFGSPRAASAGVGARLLATAAGAAALGLMLVSGPAAAQESDIARTPSNGGFGIQKSLEEQIGAGRGDRNTPDSSRFLIARDPFRAIARGRQIFQRKFSFSEGLGPRTDDGVGNIGEGEDLTLFDASRVAGLADSCAACHGRPRGSAGHGGNVFTRPDSRDAPHLFGLGLIEMLADEITADLRAIRDAALARAQRSGQPVRTKLESKRIDYGWLTANPDGSVDPSEVRGVDEDLRVKPFFAEGSAFSIRQFGAGALNAEMGLETPDPDLLQASRGDRVVTPAGMVLDGERDAIEPPPVASPDEDGDGDGVTDEVHPALLDHLEFYLLNYFKPGSYVLHPESVWQGRRLMKETGCTSCHVPDLTIDHDRRVADVETSYDPEQGEFNGLFSTAKPLFTERTDAGGQPALRQPSGGRFVVRNVFTDLKRHDLGPKFWERNFDDGEFQKEFVTEPLWGVGSTSPYGHDGRSINLREVILRHGGEAQESSDAFAALPDDLQSNLLDFLESLVLFPPADTASNLHPVDPGDPDFPQFGHGSIALSALFIDPKDPE